MHHLGIGEGRYSMHDSIHAIGAAGATQLSVVLATARTGAHSVICLVELQQ